MTPEQLDALSLTTTLPFTMSRLSTDGHQAAEVETLDGLLVIVTLCLPIRVMVHDPQMDGETYNLSTESSVVEGVAEAVLDGLSIARAMRPTQADPVKRFCNRTTALRGR